MRWMSAAFTIIAKGENHINGIENFWSQI